MNKKILVSLLTVSALGMAPSFASSYTNAQVSAMTGAEVDTALDASEITDAQIRVVTPAAVSAMTLDKLSSEQIGLLGYRQVETISAAQFIALAAATASKIGNFTPSSFRAVSSAVVGGFNTAVRGALTVDLVNKLGSNATALAADIADLQSAVFPTLSDEVIAQIDGTMAAALTAAQVTALGTKIALLDPNVLVNLTVSHLSDDQVEALGKNVVYLNIPDAAAVTALKAIGPKSAVITDTFENLTSADVTGMGATAITAWGADVGKFSEAALGALTVAEANAITVTILEDYLGEKVKALSTIIVSDRKFPEGSDFNYEARNLTVKTLPYFTVAQISAVHDLFVSNLTGAQIALLSDEALGAITASHMTNSGWSDTLQTSVIGTKLAKFSPAAIAAIPEPALAGLTKAVYESFTVEQVKVMTDAQLMAIGASDANDLLTLVHSAINKASQ